MECAPIDSVEVETCAVPPVKVTVPRFAAPSRNVTVPDGMAPAGLLATVAVKVTWLLNSDGLTDEVTLVVVGWFVTVWTTGLDVDCPYEALPPYVAVIVCVPPDRLVVAKDATLLPDKAAVPMVVAPSENVTVPVVGVPELDRTVAVKVTETLYAVVADDCVRVVVEFALTTVTVTGVDWEPGRFASPP